MKSESGVSEAIQRQLVAMLFNQTHTLVIAGLAFLSVLTLCWVRTGEAWFAWWAVLTVSAMAARLVLEFAFHHRTERAGEIRTWRNRFIAGAWVMGAIWGLAALTVVNREDPIVQLFAISVQAVIIMGAAARNASCPLAALGQTVLGLAPLFVAFLTAQDPYYRVFSAFPLFAFFAALTLIHHLHDQHIRLLCLNEDNVSLVREAQQVNLELAAANGRLEHAATTDALTQIANRRRFDSSLTEAVRRAQREGTALTLLFLDIDSFKGFNDLYGHQAGDTCLQRVATGLSSSFRRPGDLVARYGGEEFSVILPQTDLGAALALAEAVRYNIEALALPNAASAAGVISVSIGVTSFAPELYARPEDFIRSADEALYAAKRAGRNCVRAARNGDCRSSVSVSAAC